MERTHFLLSQTKRSELCCCANHCHTSEEFRSSALIDLEAHVTLHQKGQRSPLLIRAQTSLKRFPMTAIQVQLGFYNVKLRHHRAPHPLLFLFPPQSCVAIALHGKPQIKRKALYADAYFPLIRANVHQSRHTALPPHCGSQGGQERSKPPSPSPPLSPPHPLVHDQWGRRRRRRRATVGCSLSSSPSCLLSCTSSQHLHHQDSGKVFAPGRTCWIDLFSFSISSPVQTGEAGRLGITTLASLGESGGRFMGQ